MSNLPKTQLPDGARVAVVDDVLRDAEVTMMMLSDAGLEPVTVDLPANPKELVQNMLGNFAGVVCDHRLQTRVSYYGAEVVAECVEEGLPAILLTTFADPRDNAVIQTFRPHIPGLLRRGSDSSGIALRKALDYAVLETSGSYSETRRPYRTVARVTARYDDQPATVELAIPAWSTSQVASFPQDSMAEFGKTAKVGQRFLADVNIYCPSHLDLYATNFEPIPDVDFADLIGGPDD